MKVLVTGANGFIGKNLRAALAVRPDTTVLCFDQEHSPEDLAGMLAEADIVFHLAGVNRPQTDAEFTTGNVGLTETVCAGLLAAGRATPIVLASSVQAALDNPYGASKRQAEEVVARYARAGGARCTIYRLKNVFGKWCRPNYNSVVATFCHNISRDEPITISHPDRELELVYVDDVVAEWVAGIGDGGLGNGDQGRGSGDWGAGAGEPGVVYLEVAPSYRVTLGRLAELIRSFRALRQTLLLPDLADEFTRKLYGTYVSYLPQVDFAYALQQRCDGRGCLAEFVKSASGGQIFVSRTRPGITRGNHYHHTKTEKFLVLEGEALIRFRHILGGEVIEVHVRGEDFRVVDIPTGYTHSIENTGTRELVTLFWVSEVFDPDRPDTQFLAVQG